jgi:hypothetical protein
VVIYFLSPHGALAQLGERIAGSDEVRGSIPLGSIMETLEFSRVFALTSQNQYIIAKKIINNNDKRLVVTFTLTPATKEQLSRLYAP